jgi:transcriptional regulator with XRE-family HTH domain
MRGKQRGGPVDAVVGRTIRVLRLQRRVSQSALGKTIGVSFQQIQKYENGSNRVGASRLVQIAQALQVPLDSLFQRVDGARPRKDVVEDPLALLSDGQTMRVARAFSGISNSRIRVAIVMLVETIARAAPD